MTCSPAKTVYFSAEMHSSVPGNEWRRYLIRLVALYDCNLACERWVDTVPAESAKAITKASAMNFAAEQSMAWAFRYRQVHLPYAGYSQLTGILTRKGPQQRTL